MSDLIWLPLIDAQRCSGCGDCVSACPTGALHHVAGTSVLIDPPACDYCAKCETICPDEAISLPYQVLLQAALDTA